MEQILTWAVPGFIGLMLLEWAWSLRRRPGVYTARDTLTNLGSGMGSEVFGLVTKAVGLAGYAMAYHALWPDTGSWLTGIPWLHWTVALLGVDLCYYWVHRAGHEWHLMWAFHVVHHQSERYNLAVALRQSWFGGALGWIFYVPLALAGVSPDLFAASLALNLLYQFLIHTQAVDRLGSLEWVLNTPSHHRVHHAMNRRYLDKNYAGVLIVWDRLFGTFEPETEPVRWGTVTGFAEYDAVRANVLPLRDLARAVSAQRGWRRAAVLFRWPGWQPGDRSAFDAVERAAGSGQSPAPVTTDAWGPRVALGYAILPVAIGLTVAAMATRAAAPAWQLAALSGGSLALVALLGRICRGRSAPEFGRPNLK